MTLKQRLVKKVYPLFTWLAGKSASAKTTANARAVVPPHAIYSFMVQLGNGAALPLQNLQGKKILLVNTASNCGYTPQYTELQTLYQQANDKVEIIGFPANDFREQEKGSDEEIAAFCQLNFGVTFPLAKKSSVVAGPRQNPIFKWLSATEENGWNNKAPEWNFAKYLINEHGVLTHYFPPAVSPISAEVLAAINTTS